MQIENTDTNSLFNNLQYVISAAWKLDKKLFLYFGLYTILSSVLPFANLFFPKAVLDELVKPDKEPMTFVWLIAGFMIPIAIIGYFASYLEGICNPHLVRFRFNFINMHG